MGVAKDILNFSAAVVVAVAADSDAAYDYTNNDSKL